MHRLAEYRGNRKNIASLLKTHLNNTLYQSYYSPVTLSLFNILAHSLSQGNGEDTAAQLDSQLGVGGLFHPPLPALQLLGTVTLLCLWRATAHYYGALLKFSEEMQMTEAGKTLHKQLGPVFMGTEL